MDEYNSRCLQLRCATGAVQQCLSRFQGMCNMQVACMSSCNASWQHNACVLQQRARRHSDVTVWVPPRVARKLAWQFASSCLCALTTQGSSILHVQSRKA